MTVQHSCAWRIARWVAAAAVLVTAVACGGARPLAAAISTPAPDTRVPIDGELVIQGNVSGDSIVRVDVVVDGAVAASLSTGDPNLGVDELPVRISWRPTLVGTHIVQFKVYGLGGGLIGSSDAVIFAVIPAQASQAGLPAATPTPQPAARLVPTVAGPKLPQATLPAATPPSTPTEAATPDGAAATPAEAEATPVPATPTEAATPEPAATPVPVTPTATALPTQAPAAPTSAAATPQPAELTVTGESANVRAGPSLVYTVLGQLLKNEAAAVRGRSADGKWWQVVFPRGGASLGWVFADLVQATAAAYNVPIAPAPPTPTAGPATPTVFVTASPTAAPTPAYTGPPCTPSSPFWRGTNPNYPFCVQQDFVWGEAGGDWTIYDNGKNIPLSASWNLFGPNIESVRLRFDPVDTVCPFTRPHEQWIDQAVLPADTYRFNVNEFRGGGTFRVYLLVRLTDGRSVTFGDKRLCIN